MPGSEIELHHRRSTRLQSYDYAHPGAHFVTICTKWARALFGHIEGSRMVLSGFGEIVRSERRRPVQARCLIIRCPHQMTDHIVRPSTSGGHHEPHAPCW